MEADRTHGHKLLPLELTVQKRVFELAYDFYTLVTEFGQCLSVFSEGCSTKISIEKLISTYIINMIYNLGEIVVVVKKDGRHHKKYYMYKGRVNSPILDFKDKKLITEDGEIQMEKETAMLVEYKIARLYDNYV
jgi:hypothetical protein